MERGSSRKPPKPVNQAGRPEAQRRASRLRGKRLEQKTKDEIVRILVARYREDPLALWAYLPELAAMLEDLVKPQKRTSGDPLFSYHYLTEQEREFRLGRLQEALSTFASIGRLSTEKAVQVIEDAAALREDARSFTGQVLQVMQKILGIPQGTGKEEALILKGEYPLTAR